MIRGRELKYSLISTILILIIFTFPAPATAVPVLDELARFINIRSRQGEFTEPAHPELGRFLGATPNEITEGFREIAGRDTMAWITFNPDLRGQLFPTFTGDDLDLGGSFATENMGAQVGLGALVQELRKHRINTDSLEGQVLPQNEVHREVDEAGGLMINEEADAVIFLPGITFYDWGVVVVYDGNTHIVVKPETKVDLVVGNFQEDKRLTDSAKTATHELLHALIFRLELFEGGLDEEEQLVRTVENLIAFKVRGEKFIEEGSSIPELTQVLYENFFDDTINFGGQRLLDELSITRNQLRVPEPSTLALFGIGALGMFGYGARRRKAVA